MITLESAALTLDLEPRRGAKIASMRQRATGREWIEGDQTLPADPPDPGVSFDEGDMCGWDEMMPTIEPCRYPGGDLELADHGELWRRAWDVVEVTAMSAAAATTTTVDPVLGCRIFRTLRLVDETLLIEYALTNESSAERCVLWAAHPLFAHRPGTRLVLEGLLVETDEGEGQVRTWPADGLSLDTLAAGEYQKLFARGCVPRPRATLIDADGPWLRLGWSRDDASYLGIWLDQAALARHPVVALEPTNAGHDALDVALASDRFDRAWCLAPGASRRWRLEVTTGTTKSVVAAGSPGTMTRSMDR